MQFTIEEQRSIERGEAVRLTPPEFPVECVVMRADIYDRMQLGLSEARLMTVLPVKSAVDSMQMDQCLGPRFKPASRRWNLVGMAVGTAVGALPVLIPAPIGPFLTWVSMGTVIGFFAPFIIFLHGHGGNIDQKPLWLLCRVGAAVGCLVGAVAGISGLALPEGSIVGTCTGGLFAGFAVVDMYLRRRDACGLHEESLWEHSESE